MGSFSAAMVAVGFFFAVFVVFSVVGRQTH
jgi:hypothetical protein